MNSQRTKEIGRAKRGRLIAQGQGVPPALLTFSSRRVMESLVGTVHNLPCQPETLPAAQDEEGNFYETPGWSEEGGGDTTRPTMDATSWTMDSGLTTFDME